MSDQQVQPDHEPEARNLRNVAERLNTACRNGALNTAYAVLKPYIGMDQAEIMLLAGFSTMGGDSKRAAADHQSQICSACLAKKDGWEMRQ